MEIVSIIADFTLAIGLFLFYVSSRKEIRMLEAQNKLLQTLLNVLESGKSKLSREEVSDNANYP